MELRYLRTFLIVAETLNISEAGRRLRVTQPALSRQIRDLEQIVGHELFIRRPGGLRLTPTGRILREQGTKAVMAVDEALRSARNVGAKDPPVVRVGYYGNVGIWALILAPALKQLERKFPEVACQVTEMTGGEMVTALRKERLEVAILGPGDFGRIPGVKMEIACTVPGMVIMPLNHRLAKKRLVSVEDLRDEEIVSVTHEAAPGRDRAFIAACRAAGFSPVILNAATNLPEAIMIMTKRMAVGVLGSFASLAPHPGVAFIKLKPPGVLLDIHVACTENSRRGISPG
jgi:DNA-binding transcriptional LysR family regulator